MNITKLSDDFIKTGIKEVFPLEEKDFSPWIANNLQDIEEIISKHIETYELEKSCGRYESDIVATTSDGDIVIIENKLGTFDHDHFGKALTYMSYFHAKTIVWICDKYYDEHIKAINQLNDMTSDEYTFYALELKLFKYDDNNVKYDYHVCVEPDYIVKRINTNNSSTQVNENIVDFYNNVVNKLNSNNIKFTFDKRGRGYGWSSLKTKEGTKLNLFINASSKAKSIHCAIENGDDEIYNKLINIIQSKYPTYQFEILSGIKNKNILRLICKNKLNWNNHPNEQVNNIIKLFLELYNIITNINEF